MGDGATNITFDNNGWAEGSAPVAVVMISLNEAHNMQGVLENIRGWASEVFLVDSYSSDATVDIALRYGVHVVQRKFQGFGDQWNFAVNELPVRSPWTMKLDPDERLSDHLKREIARAVKRNEVDAYAVKRGLWFMGRRLTVDQEIVRVWRTGQCRFSDVRVNEYPIVAGRVVTVDGELEHHDSPDLHQWFEKQNKYSTAEAVREYRGEGLAVSPRLLGSPLQRRMWLKRLLTHLPMRSLLIFMHCYLWQGAWRCGRVGIIWSYLRSQIYRWRAIKACEMRWRGRETPLPTPAPGQPHPGAIQADALEDHRPTERQHDHAGEIGVEPVANRSFNAVRSDPSNLSTKRP